MAEATYYIDKEVGQDIPEHTGEKELPYKSLGYAVFIRGDGANFLTRKSLTG
jgi:asparaginyl-tRNA synthetase